MLPEDMKEFSENGLISPERMRAVDKNAVSLGVETIRLMESAGKSLAEKALESSPERVLLLCGTGNNGGDGLVAARYLQACAQTDVILAGREPSAVDAQTNFATLKHCAVSLHTVQSPADVRSLKVLFDKADLIIDALLGTGAHGRLREPLFSCVASANESTAPVLSADLPTPGIRAGTVCSFHRPKTEGSFVVDIGIPLAAECFTGPGDLTVLKKKEGGAHKGAGGSVLVIGGGPYQGAPYLAAFAALRGGADIVRVATPNYLPYPDLIVEKLEGTCISKEHLERLQTLATDADVVVCGCGLGTNCHSVVREVAPFCRKAVFDADALQRPLPVSGETIYTPHAGEFARSFDRKLGTSPAARAKVVKQCAESGTILLKGQVDIVSDGERVRFNSTGCPAMTTGGTGDVLAGLAGALLCRLPAFDAACIAAYVNGCAGERISAEKGDGLTAGDLPEKIAKVMNQ